MTTILSTPKGEVIIRPATSEDAEAIFALRLEGLRVNPENFAADIDMTAAGGAQEWADMVAKYATEQSGTMMIASAGTKLVGMTGIIRRMRPKIRHYATVWGVYVNSDWRGLRIAEALIQGCIDWAKAHEVLIVNLGVNTQNTAAIQCYKRCGFAIYGTEPKVVYFNGIYYDEYLMVKFLREDWHL